MATADYLVKELKKKIKPGKATALARFFKTSPGQYGHGDVFIGVMVPQTRQIAQANFQFVGLPEVQKLLNNKIHEARLLALLILLKKFQQSRSEKDKKIIYNFYLKNIKQINNWDLVDLTAPGIVGEYLQYKNKNKLYQLARMKNLWSRRISILACFAFIKNNDFIDALRLAKFHLPDQHDLMHKAVGWLLREIGKRDTKVLKQFLKINYQQLPRTTLRYAIERFDEKTRKKYLSAMLDSL